MTKKLNLIVSSLVLAGTLSLTLPSASAQGTPSTPPTTPATPATPTPPPHEKHPAIHRAIASLRAAKADLKRANHDFGGHREAALKSCDEAIAQLELALKNDKE